MIFQICLMIFAGCMPSRAASWTHLELGAANYARTPDGHPARMDALEQTIFNLVRENGNRGRLIVNDLSRERTRAAAEFAELVVNEHGLSRVEILELSGDFRRIAIPVVDSMDLKNPERPLLSTPGLGKTLRRLADQSRSGLRVITNMDALLRDRLALDGVRLGPRLGTGEAYVHRGGEIEDEYPGVFVIAPRPDRARNCESSVISDGSPLLEPSR